MNRFAIRQSSLITGSCKDLLRIGQFRKQRDAPTLFDFSKKGRTAFSKAQNPGVGNLLRGLLNMKKHVKKCPLDPGAGDIPGFQKVCKLGKGLVLILAGENSSGKSVGHVQVCAQAR